jgi:hypothetical protein
MKRLDMVMIGYWGLGVSEEGYDFLPLKQNVVICLALSSIAFMIRRMTVSNKSQRSVM